MRVLITAGPTREPMDPVRYLTNASSGAMGFAIAKAFQNKRTHVTVVCGPTAHVPPQNISLVPVITARQMDKEVSRRLPKADVFIATAAVCDFRFEKSQSQKIKKGQRSSWTVRFVKNPDILKNAGIWKKKKNKTDLLLIGFALETSKINHAMTTKLREKNLDLIIGNTPKSFSGPTITPLWLERGSSVVRYPRMSKDKLAEKMVRWVLSRHGK